MRPFATDNPRDWDQLLRQFDAAYNNAPIEGTPFSPISIFRGWVSIGVAERVVSPIDVAPLDLARAARSSFVRDHEANRLRAKARLVDDHTNNSASRARRYDADAPVAPFKAGDWVLMHTPTAVKGLSQKFIDQLRGPYRIFGPHTSRAGVLAPNALARIYVKSGETKSADVDRLHLYHPSLDWLNAENVHHHGGS